MVDIDLRLTRPMLKILQLFLQRPREAQSGADISKILGISSGTLYPILARFERAGWLGSEWEVVEPKDIGRPRRRYYHLTGKGQRIAHEVLTDLQVPAGDAIWAR